MKRILFMPPEPWYVEVHMEYLIRHLGSDYVMHQGDPGVGVNKYDPVDYDLLVPLLATHHRIPTDKYGSKMAAILWEPREGCWNQVKWCAATTPLVVKAMENDGWDNYTAVTPGIDTNLFQPFPQVREDDLLHVGLIGCHHNPRHRIKEIVLPLLDIPGVKFDFYYRNFFPDRQNDIDTAGGQAVVDNIVNADKRWVGIPTLYNKMDLLLKVDADPGLTFPIMEAAACGVPFIATNVGIESEFASFGAGMVIEADEVDKDGNGRSWYIGNPDIVTARARHYIEHLRDNPEKVAKMGMKGRKLIEQQYTWEAQLPQWKEFFEKSLDD